MDLLHQLLDKDNPVEYMQYLFEGLDNKSEKRLRAMMSDLKENGYIITLWADNLPDYIGTIWGSIDFLIFYEYHDETE